MTGDLFGWLKTTRAAALWRGLIAQAGNQRCDKCLNKKMGSIFRKRWFDLSDVKKDKQDLKMKM